MDDCDEGCPDETLQTKPPSLHLIFHAVGPEIAVPQLTDNQERICDDACQPLQVEAQPDSQAVHVSVSADVAARFHLVLFF